MGGIGSNIFRILVGLLLGLLLLVPVELAMQDSQHRFASSLERLDPSTMGKPDDPVLPLLGVSDPTSGQSADGQNIQFNERGMRGSPIISPKPARVRRILAIGSDVPFGTDLTSNEVFGQVAVDVLGGGRVGLEFVNAARPSFSSLQSLNLMEMRGWAIEPDLIIVGDNHVNWLLGLFPDDEYLVPLLGPQQSAPFLARFALYRAIYNSIGRWQDGREARRAQMLREQVSVNAEGRIRVGTNAFARVLDTLHARAVDHGAELVFMIFPVPGDIAFGNVPRVVGQYRTVLRDTARRHGILVVDGARALSDEERPKTELFDEKGEPSQLGHRLLGQALARSLRGWMRGGRVGSRGEGGAVPTYTEPKLEDL